RPPARAGAARGGRGGGAGGGPASAPRGGCAGAQRAHLRSGGDRGRRRLRGRRRRRRARRGDRSDEAGRAGRARRHPRPRPLVVDFGTESARAVLVDCADGREIAASVEQYENGVIGERLPAPDGEIELEPDWALQDPRDYVRSVEAAVPRLLADANAAPDDVV